MPLYESHEFEIVKYRHEDQAKLLQFLSQLDLQILSGFLTVQLILGGFQIQKSIDVTFVKWGLFLIDLSLAFVCSMLLYLNFIRRKEVGEIIRNCNEALGFTTEGALLPGKIINSPTPSKPWNNYFIIAIIISVVGVTIILFNSNSAYKNQIRSKVDTIRYEKNIYILPK